MSDLFQSLGYLMGVPEGAAGAAAGGDTTGSMISTIIMFGAVFLVFYFLMIRPQNKKQKEMKKMLESLKKGDKVQTIGGLRGTVWQLKEDTVVLKCDENTKLEFVRSAISNVLEQKPASEEDKPAKDEKSEKETES